MTTKVTIDKYTLKCVFDQLELICNIAVDYDGFHTVESLKELIDEMAGYAGEARKLLESVCKGEYIREKSKSMTAPISGCDIVGRSLVKTKKPHVCFGCGRKFKSGSQMEKSLVTGDSPWSCYLCATCREVLKTFPYIEEFGFGGLKQAALDLEQKGRRQDEEIHP